MERPRRPEYILRAEYILVIALLWAAVLIAVHKWYDIRGLHQNTGAAQQPLQGIVVTMKIRHLCCSGCLESVRTALQRLPWLVGPVNLRKDLPTQDQAEQGITSVGRGVDHHPPQQGYSGRIQVRLRPDWIERDAVDFLALDREIRKEGLVPDEMRLTGISHSLLTATRPHLCCKLCTMAAQEAFQQAGGRLAAPVKASNAATPGKAAPPSAEVARALVEAEFYGDVDVTAFLRKLDEAGFAPDHIKLKILPNR